MSSKRVKLNPSEGGAYFAPPSSVRFFSSGCSLLDCVLGGGGYPVGRIVNIVGDKSTGKTLLAIEACANFAAAYPKGRVRYREVEAAFDPPYAERLGLPLDRVELPSDSCLTVEDLFNDLDAFVSKCGREGGLYIVDSLDALSDKAEMEDDFGKSSYGASKAKDMSKLFRRLNQKVSEHLVTVFIISQVRDKIGVSFGRKTTRSGGRALDFYASQVLYLAHVGRLKRTVRGVERAEGVAIKALCDKNKVGLPFRECEFPILFAFGVDDVTAGLDWLKEVKALDELEEDIGRPDKLDGRAYAQARRVVAKAVKKGWVELESSFVPSFRKYGE
jgi:recombination protein RecA